MRNTRWAVAAFASALIASGPAAAFGDMGKAPTEQGTYVSGEGGYLLLDDNDISAYGLGSRPFSFHDVFVAPENGFFAGGMIGRARTDPILGFTRGEIYYLYGQADDSRSNSGPFPSLTSVDGEVITMGGSSARASAERTTNEGGLRFERDSIYNETTSLTWVLSPFLRWSDLESHATISGGCCVPHRTSDVDTFLYGVLIAVEPEKWIAPRIALVGRLGAGIYGYDADGSFRSFSNLSPDIFAASVSDSDSGVGFRGQVGAGLKFKIWPRGMLETFAEADYFSDIGSAGFPTNADVTFTPARIDTDELWELRAGARLTFAIGGQ